jgi:predicted small metal-binding protein
VGIRGQEVLVAGRHPGQGFPRRTCHERRDRAVKELKCRDVGFDCDAVVHGETVDDVMAQAGPHAKEAHGVDVTPEMAGRIRSLVRDA